MIINRSNLRDLNTAFKAAFNVGFTGVESQYRTIATVVPSTTSEEKYGWLGQIPGFREWLGERQKKNLLTHGYSIANREWEQTVSVPRPAIEDDQYGIYTPMFQEMGRAGAAHPDELVFALLVAGFATACYDGQNFFDTDHPVLDAEGSESSVSNMQAGASVPWFLLDTSRALKPIIFQERQKPDFVAKDNPEDDNVFNRNEYLYGSYARHNVGFGYWQMAFGSKAALNEANFDAAYDAMTNVKGDYGRKLGIKPKILLVGSTNRKAAQEIIKSSRKANGTDNTNQNLVEVVVSPWLD